MYPQLYVNWISSSAAILASSTNQVQGQLQGGLVQDPYALTTGPAYAVATLVRLFVGGSGGSLAPNSSPHPLDGPLGGAKDATNTPPYAWVPITIPLNAVWISFDFMLQGNGNQDSFAAALNGTNIFSLEASLIETNITMNSGLIDVTPWAGQATELFLGIVGGTATDATLTVSGVRFNSVAPPSLQAQAAGGNLIITWPISGDGYALETSTSLTGTNSWAPVTNVPVIVDFQNTVTNAISAGSGFYRLKKAP